MKENLGTPNQKAEYQRLGIELADLQTLPVSIERAKAVAKVAREMTRVYVEEINRVKMERDLKNIEYAIDLEIKNGNFAIENE